jgi:hypothetical protein
MGDSGCCAVAVVVDVDFTLARSVFEPSDCATAAAGVRQWAEAGEAWLLVLGVGVGGAVNNVWTSLDLFLHLWFYLIPTAVGLHLAFFPRSSLFPLPTASCLAPFASPFLGTLAPALTHPALTLGPLGMIGCGSRRLSAVSTRLRSST